MHVIPAHRLAFDRGFDVVHTARLVPSESAASAASAGTESGSWRKTKPCPENRQTRDRGARYVMNMVVDAESCWKAARSRDRRFEGRFVLAVRTTGVYCRPGCPAPIPKRVNVRFFACGAAAEEAGFRPCLRCRPDASPESPVLLGTSRTVARALRLIAEGEWDEGGVEALAERLGLGARQLRRLFAEELGTSPLRIARTRRVHFARKLLDETALPLTEVALGAGFTSVRRFNPRRSVKRSAPDPDRAQEKARAARRNRGGRALAPVAVQAPVRLGTPGGVF